MQGEASQGSPHWLLMLKAVKNSSYNKRAYGYLVRRSQSWCFHRDRVEGA